MSTLNPFTATAAQSRKVAATDVSQRFALPLHTPQVVVSNSGNNPVYIEFGNATVNAVAPTTAGVLGSQLIPPGAVYTLGNNDATHFAVICDAGLTTTVDLTPGRGE